MNVQRKSSIYRNYNAPSTTYLQSKISQRVQLLLIHLDMDRAAWRLRVIKTIKMTAGVGAEWKFRAVLNCKCNIRLIKEQGGVEQSCSQTVGKKHRNQRVTKGWVATVCFLTPFLTPFLLTSDMTGLTLTVDIYIVNTLKKTQEVSGRRWNTLCLNKSDCFSLKWWSQRFELHCFWQHLWGESLDWWRAFEPHLPELMSKPNIVDCLMLVDSMFPFFRILSFLFLWTRNCTLWCHLDAVFSLRLIRHCNLEEIKTNYASQTQLSEPVALAPPAPTYWCKRRH